MNPVSDSKPMIHYAKVDRWIAAMLVGAVLIGVGVGATVLLAGLSDSDLAPAAAVAIGCIPFGMGLLMGLVLRACYNMRYVITPSDLVVHCGPFRTTLPLDTIVEVFPTTNSISAPAPSLDRLQINSRKTNGAMRLTLISPKDREGFVRDLASAAPRLRRVGDGALRLKAEEPA